MAIKTSKFSSYNKIKDQINSTYFKVEDLQSAKLIWSDAYVSSNGSCLCINPTQTIQCPSATKNTTITITNNDNTTCQLIFPTKFAGSSTGLVDKFFLLPINIKNIAITGGISSGCDCQTVCSGGGGAPGL